MSSSGMGRDVHSLMLSIQHFLCRPRRRLPSKVAPRNGFGEAVVARAMPEPYQFPSRDSCQKKFTCNRKEVDLISHPVTDLVRQVGDAEVSLCLEILEPFLRVNKLCPCLTSRGYATRLRPRTINTYPLQTTQRVIQRTYTTDNSHTCSQLTRQAITKYPLPADRDHVPTSQLHNGQ